MFNRPKRNIEKDLNKIRVKFLKVYEDYRINEIFIIWLRNSKTNLRSKLIDSRYLLESQFYLLIIIKKIINKIYDNSPHYL